MSTDKSVSWARGPGTGSREPAAASNTLGPAQLDLSGLEQPPDLKELRSLGSQR